MKWLIIVLSIINISVWITNFVLEIVFYKNKKANIFVLALAVV